jgi:hypothetical protein
MTRESFEIQHCQKKGSFMGKILALSFGHAAYFVFLASFLYAIGFVTGFAVPKTIDTGVTAPLVEALLVNVALLSIFFREGTRER